MKNLNRSLNSLQHSILKHPTSLKSLLKSMSSLLNLAFVLAASFMHTFLVSLVISSSNFTDQLALLAIKSSIQIDPNNILTNNWTEESNFCNWYGISCERRRQRVTGLRLLNMGLQGTISPSIGNLSFLVILDLHNNSFHGYVPQEIAQLSHLENLFLQANLLMGDIPRNLHLCHNLTNLALVGNKFTGSIPVELMALPFLQGLYLGSNNLTGTIPPSIGNLTNLEWLGLEVNNIHGSIPHEMTLLPKLKGFNFAINNLSGFVPQTLYNMSSLQEILLSGNNLVGDLPSTIGLHLPNLEKFQVDGNHFIGEIPLYLSNSSKLITITLQNNNFTGIVPLGFGQLKLLQRCSFAGNQLTKEPGSTELTFLTAMTNCTSLLFLIISANPFSGTLPSSIGNFSSSLQWFFADSCQMEGQIPSSIGSLNVQYLLLSNNKLRGPIPAEFGRMRSLQRLYLQINALEGSIPDEFCSLKNLGEARLSNNKFSGPIPSCVGNLENLKLLFLDSNSLTSSIPSSLWGIKNLVYFSFSSNSLFGSLDQNMSSSKVLEGMDLSWNHLSGPIPSGIGGFQSMSLLNLSNNSFSGTIPDSIGRLIALERLDLSHNNLSGTIPKSLEALVVLERLNLSYNQLSGEVPTGGPFKNFTRQSFLNNEALCGAPDLQFPPCRKNSSAKKSWKYIVLGCALAATASIIICVAYILLRKYKSKLQNASSGDTTSLAAQPFLSYRELCDATDNFSERNLLGAGSYGTVYKGVLSNGRIIAVKVLNLQRDGALKSFDAECRVLREVRHRNLVKVITSCSNQEFRALVLQYMPNGSLEEWLYSNNHCLDLPQRVNIMLNVAEAIEYLHHDQLEPIVHCDLKPGNVLLDEDMVAHVGDFGIAKILGEDKTITQTKTLGTLGYIAPEYGSEGRVSTKGDIYSFGITLLETFTRKKPTDEMFGSLTLRQYIEASLEEVKHVMEVVDSSLLMENDVDKNITTIQEVILAIMELGVQCSAEYPDERPDIKEVIVQLNTIKLQLERKEREPC